MNAVKRVTISLPCPLIDRIEKQREESGISRSELIADLLWRGWRELENEKREALYRATYEAQPETPAEMEWADIAADELLTGNDHLGLDPPAGPQPS